MVIHPNAGLDDPVSACSYRCPNGLTTYIDVRLTNTTGLTVSFRHVSVSASMTYCIALRSPLTLSRTLSSVFSSLIRPYPNHCASQSSIADLGLSHFFPVAFRCVVRERCDHALLVFTSLSMSCASIFIWLFFSVSLAFPVSLSLAAGLKRRFSVSTSMCSSTSIP